MLSMRRLYIALAIAIFAAPVAVQAQGHFLRGDFNNDKIIDITDPVATLGFQFIGTEPPQCEDAADYNDDGEIDISDAIASLTWQFLDGATPASPYPVFEGDPTPDDRLGCLGTPVDITGAITEDMTLTADQVYRLISGVFVKDGATLTIEAGVTVLGDSESQGLLIVERGGKLICNGTATHPVVFTSDKPVGSRARGDWGGLIILGKGINNVEGGEAEAEGLQGQLWGGGANQIADDDSGRLSYVRCEFGGTEISIDNEVNSISIFGAGSGTTMDHVQVKYNLDDGFEWFGGSASLKWGIATGIRDDSFDYSFGWNGNGQYWVAQQRGDDADRGFEVDNSESIFSATPFTNPNISNVTLIGDPAEGSDSSSGLTLRRGTGGKLYNAVITGFSDGLDIDDDVTAARVDAGELIIDHCLFHNNGADGNKHASTDDDGIDEAAILAAGSNILLDIADPSPIADPFNLDAPNFRSQEAASSSPFDPTTLGDFFDAAQYYGAVAPEGAGDDWTQAPWVSYWQN